MMKSASSGSLIACLPDAAEPFPYAADLPTASADLTGALSRGTGILLAVMIIYRLYEDIAQQHMVDMYPALRNIMQK